MSLEKEISEISGSLESISQSLGRMKPLAERVAEINGSLKRIANSLDGMEGSPAIARSLEEIAAQLKNFQR